MTQIRFNGVAWKPLKLIDQYPYVRQTGIVLKIQAQRLSSRNKNYQNGKMMFYWWRMNVVY